MDVSKWDLLKIGFFITWGWWFAAAILELLSWGGNWVMFVVQVAYTAGRAGPS